ncbi:MAG: hypothetical protein C5B54_04325 [Acidobacteria bacterium]|nr:MAG: hypothetical protein C5B54_04325 [Acidobacteriota bacterium]
MNQRPRKLSTICYVALILSGMGLLTSLGGIAGLALRSVKIFPTTISGQNKKLAEAQKHMREELDAVTNQWRGYQIVLLIALALISAAILLAAILTLQMKEIGLRLLPLTLLFAVPLEIARSVFGFIVSHEMSGIMLRYMHEVLQTGSQAGKQLQNVDGIMSNFMQIFSGIAVFIGFVWVVAKIIFYIYSALYLKKPATHQMFVQQQIPTPPPLPR